MAPSSRAKTGPLARPAPSDRPSGKQSAVTMKVQSLVQRYSDALDRSRRIGRQVEFRVVVDPVGKTVVTPVAETGTVPDPATGQGKEPSGKLKAALAAARDRGRIRAAEILGGDDMLSAEAFAARLGTTRMTVNTKRQKGQLLGLPGATRGYRFPVWQLDAEDRPYGELAALHERLGGPWAVYRFLVQPQGGLDGLTGREALARGKGAAVVEAAEGVARDFR